MAKNTSSSAFRKIDIDQYNEDNFKEDETESSGPTGPDEGEIGGLLNQYPFHSMEGRYIEALKLVLGNAPVGSTNQQVKDNALAITLKVLLAIKSAQIEEAVGTLSLDDIDILMKYIYRGFEYPSEGSSGHLLLWHEKAFNVGGSGSIVRVLSDRMRV
ncbi:Actin-related protein 2/3 complex subunit 5 [Papilio machaon]|uniref:Actin-related protein 2/3 complex subunit 5 n=1 Tax=Papilio machaon TaxID=76193 RepID=A0A194RCF7_PAPMA|nr:Actin-related protein 2/3 complex subunit 5 [Papilio machaon]